MNVPGIIEPGKLYAADEARQRLRMGTLTWRRLCRSGLRVTRCGHNVYVTGDELLRALGAGGGQ